MKNQSQARKNRSNSRTAAQSETALSPVRKNPDASIDDVGKMTDSEIQSSREAFRERVESMSNDQFAELIRKSLYHPDAGVYLRALLGLNLEKEPVVRAEDVLRHLVVIADSRGDKRSAIQKALSELNDAEGALLQSCQQVEALSLATTSLVGDIRQGNVELVRLDLIQPGLRHNWQALVDFMMHTLDQMRSAIKHLSAIPADK